jgi:hypothetical protein
VLIGTPHYAIDLARGLARVHDLTFDVLPTEERDRYYELAAWITDEYVAGDDFHEGCYPRDTMLDLIAQAYEDGYEHRGAEDRQAIETLAGTSGEAAKAVLRTAYAAIRGTQSGEAMRHKTASYVRGLVLDQ